MREGDKKSHTNATRNKGCWLQAADNGRVVRLIVRNDGWTTAFHSGGCNDYWDWSPNSTPKAVEEVNSAVRPIDDDWTSVI